MALEVVLIQQVLRGMIQLSILVRALLVSKQMKTFFEYLLNHNNRTIDVEMRSNDGRSTNAKQKWCISETMDVNDVLSGGKGFEMMFAFKKKMTKFEFRRSSKQVAV